MMQHEASCWCFVHSGSSLHPQTQEHVCLCFFPNICSHLKAAWYVDNLQPVIREVRHPEWSAIMHRCRLRHQADTPLQLHTEVCSNCILSVTLQTLVHRANKHFIIWNVWWRHVQLIKAVILTVCSNSECMVPSWLVCRDSNYFKCSLNCQCLCWPSYRHMLFIQVLLEKQVQKETNTILPLALTDPSL